MAAVGVALPALTSVAALLSRRCPGNTTDVPAEVLCGFLETLSSVDIERPRIMLRLRWAAYRAGLRMVSRTPRERDNETHWSNLAPGALPSGHPDIVLAEALAAGVVTAIEADVIGATRLESTPIAQWAADHGMSNWAAYKCRRRAELRLARYISEQLMDTDLADETSQKHRQHFSVQP